VNIHNIDKNFNEEIYQQQLEKISDYIEKYYLHNNKIKELSILTDLLFIDKHDNCMAGKKTFIISPDEKIYTCCAVYSNENQNYVGDNQRGITVKYDNKLYDIDNSNLCRICDCYHCKNCVYINKKFTKEVNVSPSFQCRKSHVEKLFSKKLFGKLYCYNSEVMIKGIEISESLDPIYKFLSKDDVQIGYYKYIK